MYKNVRRASATMLAAISLVISSCATTQSPPPQSPEPRSPEPQSPVLSRVVAAGKLRVGMSADQPPLNVASKTGQMIGLEVDLANALADALDLDVELVQKPFGQLLGALESGDVDIVMSGVDITPERSKAFSFVGPYMLSGKSLVTTSEALAGVQRIEDVNQPSITFVALENSTSAEFVKKQAPNAKLVEVDTYEAAVAMVKEGTASAMIADYTACTLAILKNPDAGLVTLREPLSIEPLGIAVSATDDQFYNLIDNFIDVFESTGLLTALRKKWFENPGWLNELP